MLITRSSLSLLFSLSMASLVAQDTIMVQTLTFDSITTRRGWWQFPDSTHQFRKVLMMHTLKCDPATTQDQFACGEWDYLTYNYLYDHTGVLDSADLEHPFFLVGNDAPDSVVLVSSPMYDQQQRVSYRHVVDVIYNEMDHVVGNGNTVDLSSLAPAQGQVRSQFIYKASELQQTGLLADTIDHIRFNVNFPGSSIQQLVIRMANVADTAFTDAMIEGGTIVHDHSFQFQTGVNTIELMDPIAWDGTSSILVELSIGPAIAGTATRLFATNTAADLGIRHSGHEGYVELDNDHIGVDAFAFSALGNEVTVMCWVNGDPTAQPQNDMLFEGRDAAGRRQLNVHLPWSNERVYWDAGDDGSGYDRIDKLALASEYAGQWNHWAFTKNTVSGQMKIYLNGALWHSGNGKVKPMAGITTFNIGADYLYNNNYAGAIDEFAVFAEELDQATIQAWMDRHIDSTHPNAATLLYSFGFDGAPGDLTFTNDAGNGANAWPMGTVQRRFAPSTSMHRRAQTVQLRPDIAFVQGVYDSHVDTVILSEPVLQAGVSEVEFQVSGNTVIPTDTAFGWQAGYTYTRDPNGIATDSTWVAGTQIDNYQLFYFGEPFEVIDRFELGRYITPYGIQLSLGPNGFTWVFDVTEYQHLLRDSVDLSAGNQQELIDLKFMMIEGTPPRDVVRLQRPWGQQRSYLYRDMSDDSQLAPVTVDLDPAASQWMLRSRLTGHGHNSNTGNYPHCCEWKNNTHYIDVNGNQVDDWHIWQTDDCALNPVYPQGGTWPGAREGWCPGDVVKDHETELTSFISGPQVTLDYRITPVPTNNLGMGNGNYVANFDLFEFSAAAHQVDAEIYEVLRPNDWEYRLRDNPMCSDPVIVLRNAGAQDLTSVTFSYGVSNGTAETHTWTGQLKHMEMTEVVLPITSESFWYGDDARNFTVQVINANGGTDAHAENDSYTTHFDLPAVYEENFVLNIKTNNRPWENTATIRDVQGNVVFLKDMFTAQTSYFDTLDLAPGCYTLELTDTGNDGLYYWADGNQGTGYLRFRKKTGGILKSFENEFGHSIKHAFAIGWVLNTAEASSPAPALSVFPNPSNGQFTVQVDHGQGPARLEVLDLSGRVVTERILELTGNDRSQIDLSGTANGIYQLRIITENSTLQTRLMKQ